MELQETLMKRKSVRRYKKQSVDLAKIESMIEAANLAPTWKNSQVVRYYVVSSEQMLSKLKQCLAEFNQENAKDAPVLIVSSIVLNRSGFERDGTPSNEIKNGWGCYDCGMHDMVLLLKAAELDFQHWLWVFVIVRRSKNCLILKVAKQF